MYAAIFPWNGPANGRSEDDAALDGRQVDLEEAIREAEDLQKTYGAEQEAND